MQSGLPYELDIKDSSTFIDKQDMVQVQNFAKDTGDFFSLSQVDTQVIALGVKMARVKKEHDCVKT